jgi:hypothetical protein
MTDVHEHVIYARTITTNQNVTAIRQLWEYWLNISPWLITPYARSHHQWVRVLGADHDRSEHKHTHRHVLHLDCLQKGAGTFAMSPCSKDENVRERERETVTGIVCCSKYTVCYLNMLVHSAYMLVGQSANIPKSCSHCTSHACAFLVAWHTWWLQGVPRPLNCLSSRNRGHTLLAAGAH